MLASLTVSFFLLWGIHTQFIIDFLSFKGQMVGVIGKVGAGKSSLLAAITAEMEKRHGQVILF